jgi:esterase/lipase superfamily enzyme
MCAITPLKPEVQARIKKVVSISGLHDLRPLMNTKMNEKLILDEDEAFAESAALQKPAKGIELVCWVGAEERPEFLRQNRLLADIWASCGIDTEWHEEPNKHHFDVIDDLSDPQSALNAHFAPDG